MTKKVLIISRSLSDNFGDQAISYAMKKLFTDRNIESISTDLVVLKDSTVLDLKNLKMEQIRKNKKHMRFLNTTAIIRWFMNKNKLFKVLDENLFDCILIGGGELIQSSKYFPIALYYWVKKAKKKNAHTPIILFSIGVEGKGYTNIQKKLLSSTFKLIEKIYVRDENSKKNLLRIFGVYSEEIVDVVFSHRYNRNEKYEKLNALLGITSMRRIQRHNLIYNSESNYFSDMYHKYTNLKEKWGSCKCIYSDSSDYLACLNFQNYCRSVYNTEIEIAEYTTLEGFTEEIVNSKIVVSPRMHACIIGLIADKKVNPICISDKMLSFSNKYIQSERNLHELSQIVNSTIDNIIRNNCYER